MDKQDIKKPGSAIVRRDRTEKTGSDEERLMILLGRKKKSYVWMNIERYGKDSVKDVNTYRQAKAGLLFGFYKTLVGFEIPTPRLIAHGLRGFKCKKCRIHVKLGVWSLNGHHIAGCGCVVNCKLGAFMGAGHSSGHRPGGFSASHWRETTSGFKAFTS